MKGFFEQLLRKITAGFTRLRRAVRHLTYPVKIRPAGELSLYHILKLYSAGLANGALAARAESVAYSFFMAVFPAVAFVFSVIPYIPIDGLQQTLMQTIEEAMPPHTWETVGPTVNDIIHIKRGGLLSFSLLGILIFTTNGINGLIANFRTSYNKISMRSYLNQYLISLSLVLLLLLILITTLALIVASRLLMEYLEANGGLAFDTIDPGAIVKYGLIGFSLLVCVSLIFHFGPRQRGLPFFSPGAILSTLLVLASSSVFAFYINHFSQYNKLYGSIGAVLIFMFWLFIIAFLLLVGFELNAAIVRSMSHLKQRQTK